jgi:creatinine amidohydrolase
MRIRDMNWMQVDDYLRRDDRVIVPLGSTEQHGYLSLLVDAILPERLAVEAAEPLGVPVLPALPFGIAPYFLGFPGTISLQSETYSLVIDDVLDSLAGAGFRRILLVNGHGGNAPAGDRAVSWMQAHPGVRVRMHNWWNAPATLARINEIDPVASHASWMENFPWTRLPGVTLPATPKDPIDRAQMATLAPDRVREYLGDGNFAGLYERSDEEMLSIWAVAVDETRALIETGWT